MRQLIKRITQYASQLLTGALALVPISALAAPLQELSLGELLKQSVPLHASSQTASAVTESVLEAPAAIIVLDAKELQRRGYTGLDDVLPDLPGFDVINTHGTMPTVAYQRGYRTPWLQRTLVLIDSRVDNNLWNHSAQLSRQYPLSAIARIEVLYGPASAVYGPNAFLGVINIITVKGDTLAAGEHEQTARIEAGSFDTYATELLMRGNWQRGLNYRVAARLFASEEAGLDDFSDWGYAQNHWLEDPSIWGAGIGNGIDPATGRASPIGDINLDGQTTPDEHFNGKTLGRYANPSDNYSLMGEVAGKHLRVGGSYWKTVEGYGMYYSFADAQPQGVWLHDSKQVFADYTYPISNRWHSAPIQSHSQITWRSNQVGGDWAESFGNYVSLSRWQSESSAVRFNQQWDIPLAPEHTLSMGLKWEKKRLAKLYWICNYWDGGGVCPAQAANSVDGYSSDGSGVRVASEISSLNPTPLSPAVDMSGPHNRSSTNDVGAFVHWLKQNGKWRYNLGARVDRNSEYGSVVTPRGALNYAYSPSTTFKWIYGEAFQEPSAKDLYGGWNGRQANNALQPERARNVEWIAIYQRANQSHELSLYRADYRHVIAGGENVGKRRIFGTEYRGRWRFDNPLAAQAITAQFYYTYTNAQAERHYNNVTGEWQYGWAAQGDISPHKLQAAINIPVAERWNLNLRGNWYSSRNVFSENPLRQAYNPARSTNRKVPAYRRFDLAAQYEWGQWRIDGMVENLFEEDYWHPGVESAGSGDDFSIDSDGFQNSLIPQINQRSYHLRVQWRW